MSASARAVTVAASASVKSPFEALKGTICDAIEARKLYCLPRRSQGNIRGLILKQFPVNRSDLLQRTIASRSFSHCVWIALTAFHVGPLGSVDQFFVIKLFWGTYSP